MASKQAVSSLYRRCLKLSLDWAVHRYIWRGQALYIRSLFEANRDVREPRQQRVRIHLVLLTCRRTRNPDSSQILFEEAEALLEKWKHPDPYRPPTAPGGSKFERNIPAPILDPPPHMVL
ncbi:Complex 1 LYR protein [Lasallia pustulata]|uniref:NADH dehydrogenase [ubiquinone] 1 beta subcomplex subunit 9 n=1 Tax=Lasallia pustulata TaxID=136370 RepID=A0A1W5D2B2_9LECA|nr:Complex 1 LYR protein [Lasallia pustulata]